MRILLVSPFPPARDGIGAYSQAVIGALRAEGHQALVVVPRRLQDRPGDVIGALGPRQPDLAALRESVLTWGPDVIHVQFAVAAFGAQIRGLFSWLRGIRSTTVIPVVATMHEVTRDTAALRGAGRALYRALAGHCDHVIVHTGAALAILTGRVGVPEAKVSVIPHPEAAPPRAASTPRELRARFGLGDAELLVAFGFVHADKGLRDLVRALAILRRSGSPPLDDVRVVIAGTVRPRHGLFRLLGWRDRCHLARVLRLARRTSLHREIVLTGYVPETDVAAWFQAAAAMVLPYRRTEQSGVAALANACGVPVLASTAGGLGEQYASSRWTFPPRDPRELARVLARFLTTSPDERAASTDRRSTDRRSTDGRSTGRRHDAALGSVIKATVDVYHAAARAKTPRGRTGSLPDAS